MGSGVRSREREAGRGGKRKTSKDNWARARGEIRKSDARKRRREKH
jgi:hypothetical protein